MVHFQVNYKTIIRPGTPYADYEDGLSQALSTGKFVPTTVLPSSQAITKQINDVALPLKDYFDANIDNFIIGKTSMSEWDAFVAQMRQKGGDQLTALYNQRLESMK
jgi:hypothetical protein